MVLAGFGVSPPRAQDVAGEGGLAGAIHDGAVANDDVVHGEPLQWDLRMDETSGEQAHPSAERGGTRATGAVLQFNRPQPH